MDSGSGDDGGGDTAINSTSSSCTSSRRYLPTSGNSASSGSSSPAASSSASSSSSTPGSPIANISQIRDAKDPEMLKKQMILRTKKVEKLTNLSNLQVNKESCLPHLKLNTYGQHNKDNICRHNILFSKAHGSSNAEVYCLQDGTTHVKHTDDWRNCTFLASREDGWVLFLEENGRNLFYLQVGTWIRLEVIPPLPETFSPSQCMVSHNGWRATFSHDPRNPKNTLVLLGLVIYYNTQKEEIVILSLEPSKCRKWQTLKIENDRQLENDTEIKIIDGVVSGTVLVLLNEEQYICWVSSGDRLQVLTPTSFKAVVVSKFIHGKLPVSIVVRPGKEEYIYLYQYTGIFIEPPLVAKIRLPNLEVSYIHHFPSTFYMIDYGAGYAEDNGWSEEGEFEKEIIRIKFKMPERNFKENSDDEKAVESNDESARRIAICDVYSLETVIEERSEESEESVNKGEEEEEKEEKEEVEVRVLSEPSKNGFFASSCGHHIVNYHATEEEALWQKLKPHQRCRDSFAFSSHLIPVTDASSSS